MLSPLAHRALEGAGLGGVRDKVMTGRRLDPGDALRCLETSDLAALGALANHVREGRHGNLAFYNRNAHLNFTNVCVASCKFCSFARPDDKTASEGYTLSLDEAVARVLAYRPLGITEIHIVNGLHPDLPFDYYTSILRRLRQAWPELALKAYTAVEIHFFAEKFGMDYRTVLRELIDAGLTTLPGGGAEIFAPRVRRKICDDKATADQWLEIHETAHALGLRSNATMLFGTIETPAERVDHMARLRDLQDKSGGFQVFIPLAFHPEGNMLGRAFPKPTGYDALRTYATARLFLDNFDHLKAYWIMIGEKVAQTALSFGVDDLDGTVLEERIYHMAGAQTPQALAEGELHRLIRTAGRVPAERDSLYRVIRTFDSPGRPAPVEGRGASFDSARSAGLAQDERISPRLPVVA
jgi:aminodeoxyfutalosine synthase